CPHPTIYAAASSGSSISPCFQFIRRISLLGKRGIGFVRRSQHSLVIVCFQLNSVLTMPTDRGVENQVKNSQDQKRHYHRSNDATDDHSCQGTLHLGPHALTERHWQKTEIGRAHV